MNGPNPYFGRQYRPSAGFPQRAEAWRQPLADS